jgi:hypothetical protein
VLCYDVPLNNKFFKLIRPAGYENKKKSASKRVKIALKVRMFIVVLLIFSYMYINIMEQLQWSAIQLALFLII